MHAGKNVSLNLEVYQKSYIIAIWHSRSIVYPTQGTKSIFLKSSVIPKTRSQKREIWKQEIKSTVMEKIELEYRKNVKIKNTFWLA